MMALDFQTLAQTAASRGLNTVCEGLAITALSWIALRWSGIRNSMTRFAVWFSTLLVVVMLPLLAPSEGAGFNLHASLVFSSWWATWLLFIWALIAGCLLLRVGLSLLHVARIRKQCSEIEPGLHPKLLELQSQVSCSRRIRFLVSDSLRLPAALGFFRPAVVLPSWALVELSPGELKAVVLHELAHIRRWDDWTNLMQKILKSVFFFHPALWFIDGRLALEREIACDDLVLEQTANAKIYAASLVSVAEKVIAERMRMGKALALAQTVLGRVRELSIRLAQILDVNRPRSVRGWKPASAMIGTLAMVAVGTAPYVPELVSFRSPTNSGMVSASSIDRATSAIAIPAKWVEKSTPVVASAVSQNSQNRSRVASVPQHKSNGMVIPAKMKAPNQNRSPRVTMAKSSDRTTEERTLLVIRSTPFDEDGAALWTLSVWRVRGMNGEQIQIVMNSI